MTATPTPIIVTPIKRGYEFIHEQMRQKLLHQILPSIFPNFVKRLKPLDAYPVIIGGTLVQRCAKRSAEASRIIEDLLTEDIDIKVVLKKEIADNNDPVIARIDAVRHEFIHQVIYGLDAYAREVSHDNPDIVVSVHESQKLMNTSLEFIAKIRVLEVKITYIESTRSMTLPILDMGLYTTYSVPHYSLYMNFNKNVKLPIPYVSVNKILYATCNYAYMDTIRMLVDRARYLEEKKTMYALIKFTRYVIKFMCLYVLIEQKTIKDVDVNVREAYKRAHEILTNANLLNLDLSQQKKEAAEEETVKQVGLLLSQVIQKVNIDDLVTYLYKQESSIHSGGMPPSKPVKVRKTPFKTSVKELQRVIQPPSLQ
jgi:hypothetical protein